MWYIILLHFLLFQIYTSVFREKIYTDIIINSVFKIRSGLKTIMDILIRALKRCRHENEAVIVTHRS